MENYTKLQAELAALQEQFNAAAYQLEEANSIIDAIKNGEIDALVLNQETGPQIYTLESADLTFRIFIEQMSEGAVTLNTKGKILYCNSQFAELVKHPLECIIGREFKHFIADHCQQDYEQLIKNAWLATARDELVLVSDLEEKIPVLLSLNLLDLKDGITMSMIVTDLSVLKENQRLVEEKNQQLALAEENTRKLNLNLENTVKARTHALEYTLQQKMFVERELRSNQDRLSKILETMAEGVIICEKDGEYTYVNPMAQQLIGIKEIDGPVKKYFDPKWKRLKIDGSLLPEHEDPIAMALSNGETVSDYEIAIEPPTGERFYISINTAVLREENDDIILCISTFMDVTNRRKAYEQKDEFISVASHELKTPITSLKASLQLLGRLKDERQTAMLPKLIDQANKSMSKVSVLIEDLLNTSKYNSGQLHLNIKPVNLYQLLTACCGEVRTEGKYELLIKGEKEIIVNCDPFKIEQVIVNFINNAIKYALDSYQIIIELSSTADEVKVAVQDKGPGIDPVKIPHLFDRYYRGDNQGRQYSGLGLGLYICAEIIKKHNGKIGVYSEIGVGSNFWFTLPA